MVSHRSNLSQKVELDAKVSASHQLVENEPLPTGSSTMPNGSRTPPVAMPASTGATSFITSRVHAEDIQPSVSQQINGSGSPMFTPMQPAGKTTSIAGSQASQETNGSGRLASYPTSHSEGMADNKLQHSFPQVKGTAQIISTEVPSSSAFYEPNNGDIVLGVVTHANESELSVEIGARAPAMINTRDFLPFTEVGTNSFFKLPLDNDSNETVEGFVVPPVGKVLLVGEQAPNDGAHPGESVKIGTVFLAEVASKVSGEGRAMLTCRRIAEKLTFLRLEQIMKTGEPIEIKITAFNDGGLQGFLEGVRAFLPKSELLVRPESSASLQDYVGKTLTVAVVKLEHYSFNVIVSEIKAWVCINVHSSVLFL
ncbi:hypothetical protein L7F22_063931 [Adiantum nelumboides]|nr:hypothetical protein [Adiantum nelumboides]